MNRAGYLLLRMIFTLEGPCASAVLVLLGLGHPHGHPLLRGVLFLPALAWFVLGWVMTWWAVFEWGATAPHGARRHQGEHAA